MTRLWCERAHVDGRVHEGVLIDVDRSTGRIMGVETGATANQADTRRAGVTIAGAANTHSHAFHRVLRHRSQTGRGSFWTWRDQMYAVAGVLDPDSYHRLARAVFAEMALAGYVVVGEFHYLHHQPGGRPYGEPNAMGEALVAAAAEAGVRITLLDTLYLHGGIGPDGYQALSPFQARFGDASVDAWCERVGALVAADHMRIGAAAHSVRAVDPVALARQTGWAQARDAPLHAHVSEQAAENEQCADTHGCTPTELFASVGALGDRFTAVHATHLSDRDIELLGSTNSNVCMCPTTERDLGDGIGPARRLADAGARLTVGSDSHAVIDPFEEARAIELDERLARRERGLFTTAELAEALVAGHRSLGWEDAGVIASGARADLVTISTGTVRTAGAAPAAHLEAVVFAASGSDVTHVMIDGVDIVRDGRHLRVDVASELDEGVGNVMKKVGAS